MVSERKQILLKIGATEAQPCSGPLVPHATRPHHSTKKRVQSKKENLRFFHMLMIHPKTEVPNERLIGVGGQPSL